MPHFSFSQFLEILNPRMLACAISYALRMPFEITRNKQPGANLFKQISEAVRATRWFVAPSQAAEHNFQSMGRVKSYWQDENIYQINGEHGVWQMRSVDENVLFLRHQKEGHFEPFLSYSLVNQVEEQPVYPLKVCETDQVISFEAKQWKACITQEDGILQMLDKSGNILIERCTTGIDADSGQVMLEVDFGKEVSFYGMGEKAFSLNLAGKQLALYNRDPQGYDRGDDPVYMSIPFTLALCAGRSVGIYIENTYRGWVDLGKTLPGRLRYTAAGGEMKVFFITGTPAEIMDAYTRLTGRMKLPPLWALGYHQSRWSYYPQEHVLEIARKFRERNIPCDCIHLDIHYMDDYRCFTWNDKRFPDPKGMLNQLHQMGFKVKGMIDPGLKVDSEYSKYQEGMENGYFLKWPDGRPLRAPVWPGDTHFPDFSKPEVRKWWGENYRGLLDDGFDSFWNDMNEPAIIGGPGVPDLVRYTKEGQGADHAELHNVYGLLMVRATQEGLTHLKPDRRSWVMSRSGWAGLQRYASHWTGDNKTSWDQLRLSISMVLNLGLSGVAMTGCDLGGFSGGPSAELYTRWLEVGMLMPYLRVHSMLGSADQEPWALGEEVEASARNIIEWRYKLLPYIYTAIWQANQRGVPVMRPMFWEAPGNPVYANLDDQYFHGDHLLVAPIVNKGQTSRQVDLPQGTWFDFWDGTRYEGNQIASVDAPLDKLPVFARGGAVIPLWPVQQYVGEKQIDRVTFKAFWCEGRTTSVWYEDDGITPIDSSKKFRRSEIVMDVAENCRSGSLRWKVVEGGYSSPVEQIVIDIIGVKSASNKSPVMSGHSVDQVEILEDGVWRLILTVTDRFSLFLEFG
jgi:alpha-glucosidase